MYCKFYNFTEKPFGLEADPRFLFLTETHQEAMASIVYGICERKGFISVAAEFGMGKTILIRRVLEELKNKKVHSVFLPRATLSIEEILKTIVRELKIAQGDGIKSSLIRQLNDFLLEGLPRNENLALIIDEAQELDRAVLEELRLLSNLETSSAKLLQIVLVGQPELDLKLNLPELRQFRQRIVIRREVGRLKEEESRGYIGHRLGVVGAKTSDIFTRDAVGSICKYARGVPREINLLCDSALQIGHSLGQKRIDGKIVSQAVKRMVQPPAGKTAPEQAPLTFDRQGGAGLRPIVAEKEQSIEKTAEEPPAADSYQESAPVKPGDPKTIAKSRRKPARRKTPLFLFGGLACIAIIFLLGRGYLNQTAEDRGRGVITAPAVTLKTEPAKPAAAQTTPDPSGPVNVKSASAPEPVEKKEEPKPVSTEIPIAPAEETPALRTPPASPGPRTAEVVTVVAQNGDTVSKFCQRYYRMTNTTLLDKILEFNREITNLHLINVGQKIRIPKITEADFVVPASDGSWKIHVGTFPRSGYARQYRDERALKGKTLEILPRKVSPGETWYRIFAAEFKTQAEALAALRALKQIGKFVIP